VEFHDHFPRKKSLQPNVHCDLAMLARRDETVPVGLIDSFTPVQKRGNRSNKARLLLAATTVALVVAAVLVAGSAKSDSGFLALSQSSQYDDETVVEKFDELTHKVRLSKRISRQLFITHSPFRYTDLTATSPA
jgi:hypothetical protein